MKESLQSNLPFSIVPWSVGQSDKFIEPGNILKSLSFVGSIVYQVVGDTAEGVFVIVS